MTADMNDRWRYATGRAVELRERISDYLEARASIPSGLERSEPNRASRSRILEVLEGTDEDWEDHGWQVAHRVSDTDTLRSILDLPADRLADIEEVSGRFRWAISPYYLSLVDNSNLASDPVLMQSVPSALELDTRGQPDPMAEEQTSPAPLITRRYPDRLIINVTNQCAMFCRHCQRRRHIGESDTHASHADLEAAVDYVRRNPEIRDILITGGDALLLSDEVLDWLLGELDAIPHVEIKRLGSRTPVTMPQRITPELCSMLERHHPLYLNTHFNHPQEVTEDAARACDRLSRAGIPLGNQAVLLRGINNDPNVMMKLNHELLRIRVRPYYIFHAKCVRGTTHFRCRIEEGIHIMERLRGYTSGLAVPWYIVNAPGGLGKTPVMPNYLISLDKDTVTLRTWENKVVVYDNYAGDE